MNVNIGQEACSPQIQCYVNIPEGQPCPWIEQVVSPMRLAEDVCPNALQSAWDGLQLEPQPTELREKIARLHAEASLLLEMALATARDNLPVAEEMLSESMNRYKSAAVGSGVRPHIKASLFVAYEESFEARLHGDDPADGLPAARKKLAEMARNPLLQSSLQWIGHSLWEAHFDRVLLPATPREDGKWMKVPERHMSYVIEEQEDGSHKTAYLTGSFEAASPKVWPVAFGEWALYSMQRLEPELLSGITLKENVRLAAQLVIDWLCRETDGEALVEREHAVLEHMFTSGYLSVAQARAARSAGRSSPPSVQPARTPKGVGAGVLEQNLGAVWLERFRNE